jgi:SAM-dependent methyltransferase
MLSWYRERLREHGTLAATVLLARVVWARGTTALVNKFLAARVTCPCCGWTGRKFYDYLEVGCTARGAECPRCNSHPRHRAFALWLKRVYRLRERTGTALVFAPERALEAVWAEARDLNVVRTDIEPSRGVDLLADIQRLPFDADTFDLIWCQHVLTQIPDDRAAMREMQRVLRARTGELVVSVSQERGAQTREFGRANKNHLGFWRVYGDDFAERLREAGLETRAADYGLSEEECARYGIDSDEGFFICTRAASP